jgi:pimeloyl-ACP methyl ester carboxylesterase
MKLLHQAARALPRITLLQARNIAFPTPNGTFGTSLSITALQDDQRQDPFAPIPTPRTLMVSIFTPVLSSCCELSTSPYMDPTTAAFEDARLEAFGLPSGIFESLDLQTCKSNPLHHSIFPTILISPAAGTTRLFYSAIAQEIAGSGFIVVTIDHPYDGDIVVYPDNTTIFGLDFTDDQIPLAVETRAKDISFVLDQINARSTGKFEAGVLGHSLGGAASAEAMLIDDRLAAGVNLDGTFFGDVVEKGLTRAFLIFAHDGKNLTTDPSWGLIWLRLTGWKRELMLAKSAHYTFSDLPLIVKLLGLSGRLPSDAEALLGSIDGARAFNVVTTYVGSFFDKFLKSGSE